MNDDELLALAVCTARDSRGIRLDPEGHHDHQGMIIVTSAGPLPTSLTQSLPDAALTQRRTQQF